jgi:AAA+ superfamily predicted ATPase
MIWLLAKDKTYYKDSGKKLIVSNCEKLGITLKIEKLNDMVKVFKIEDVEKILKHEEYEKVILSPLSPDIFGGFFTVIELPNAQGIVTDTQYALGITAEKELKRRTGMNITKSNYRFSDMAGAEKLHGYISQLLIAKNFGEKVKGILLTGVAGTGKSFTAKCLAGETNRILVELNFANLSYASIL